MRAAGGLCIADEVQVGYGRLGDYFWGFEQQGVVPDIVTMAKCTGNGVPVGAVVTTRAIADDAAPSEGSFFSSMGGSPWARVAALATLDVLESEGLQANAAADRTPHRRLRVEALAAEHPIIGTVHGLGLYRGIELVRDPETLEPASEEAVAICERMRELGVIVQPTSDYMNVLEDQAAPLHRPRGRRRRSSTPSRRRCGTAGRPLTCTVAAGIPHSAQPQVGDYRR